MKENQMKYRMTVVGVGALLLTYIALNMGGYAGGPLVHWLAFLMVAGVVVAFLQKAVAGSKHAPARVTRPPTTTHREASARPPSREIVRPAAIQVAAPVGYTETLRTLAAVVDAGDPFTRGRSSRVSRFCVRMGDHLGLSGRDLVDLEHAALLHDIGRTAIHREVLLKPGKLSNDERKSLHSHPQVGADMIKKIPPLATAAEIIAAHHEQPDGEGYPNGLAGDQIPVGSRIIMVAAAFDAMTSDRPYRRGLSPQQAFEELKRCSGTMFFPECVDALIELYENGALAEEFKNEDPLFAADHAGSRAIEGLALPAGSGAAGSSRHAA